MLTGLAIYPRIRAGWLALINNSCFHLNPTKTAPGEFVNAVREKL
jgi:hypothetical protein